MVKNNTNILLYDVVICLCYKISTSSRERNFSKFFLVTLDQFLQLYQYVAESSGDKCARSAVLLSNYAVQQNLQYLFRSTMVHQGHRSFHLAPLAPKIPMAGLAVET